MKSDIEDSIKVLSALAKKANSSHEAMQYAQAALNLAHATAVWEEIGKPLASAAN